MRIAKWDNLKFTLIYAVVLGHLTAALKMDSFFLKGLQFFIYTFHMPAFLFISGLFSKRTIDERRYERVLPYFFLYLFMKLFRFLVYFLSSGKASAIDLFSETGVPWFALTLFLCYLITMACARLNRRYLLVMAVAVGVMSGYDPKLGGFLTGMRLATLYPFFLAGYCAPVDRLTGFTNRRAVKVLSAFALISALVCSYLLQDRLYGHLNFLKCKAGYEALGMWPQGGLYRGAYYIIAMALVLCVIAVVPSGRCVFTRWGGRTIQVFALHYPILKVLVSDFRLGERLNALALGHGAWLVPAAALALTVVLSAGCLEPFFDWLMRPGRTNRKSKESCE